MSPVYEETSSVLPADKTKTRENSSFSIFPICSILFLIVRVFHHSSQLTQSFSGPARLPRLSLSSSFRQFHPWHGRQLLPSKPCEMTKNNCPRTVSSLLYYLFFRLFLHFFLFFFLFSFICFFINKNYNIIFFVSFIVYTILG